MNTARVLDVTVRTAPGGFPPGVLSYRQCRWCRSVMECSRLLCPVCGAADLEERTSAGLGVVARVGAVTRTDQLALRLHQTCLVTLDEGFTIPATLSADQFAVVPPGARVRVRTFGPGPRAVEFRLL